MPKSWMKNFGALTAQLFEPPAVPQGRKKRGSDSNASAEALGRCRGRGMPPKLGPGL